MYLCKEESLACSLWKKQKIAGLAGSRMSCKVCSETFEFYSIRFTTSVFYEGEDVLTEYYGIPRVLENEGEDIFFQEIYKWVRKDARVKKCFVRGYLDLLIGSLAMRGSKVDKDTGDYPASTGKIQSAEDGEDGRLKQTAVQQPVQGEYGEKPHGVCAGNPADHGGKGVAGHP